VGEVYDENEIIHWVKETRVKKKKEKKKERNNDNNLDMYRKWKKS
jgi:hypothetical protein